jgi:hypothetical protein
MMIKAKILFVTGISGCHCVLCFLNVASTGFWRYILQASSWNAHIFCVKEMVWQEQISTETLRIRHFKYNTNLKLHFIYFVTVMFSVILNHCFSPLSSLEHYTTITVLWEVLNYDSKQSSCTLLVLTFIVKLVIIVGITIFSEAL